MKLFRNNNVAIAAGLALMLAGGAAALYVISADTGNGGASGEAACAASAARASALEGFNVGDMAAMRIADNPQPAGPLSFNDADGQPKTLADYEGRTVLLNLWATWCAPCREEMPALDALEREMGGERFAVIPVSVDAGTDEKPKQFYAETGLTDLPLLHDGTLGVFNALKKKGYAFGMPSTLLIDEKGCVLASMNGPAHWSGEDAKALVRKAVGE
jgi:thiol-disulfide isomerase/thioredoxin